MKASRDLVFLQVPLPRCRTECQAWMSMAPDCTPINPQGNFRHSSYKHLPGDTLYPVETTENPFSGVNNWVQPASILSHGFLALL